MKTIKLSLSLQIDVFIAIEREAETVSMNPTELIREILTDHTLQQHHLPMDKKDWLRTYRRLSAEVANHARAIVDAQGFSEDITAKAVAAAQNDPVWLADYERVIDGDFDGRDNEAKTSLNQNIGYRVRQALGAEVIKSAAGRPKVGSAKGLAIKSYSKLTLG